MPRISLRKIDSLLSGELGEEESRALQGQVEASPQAKAYFDRQKALRSDLTWARLRQAVAADERAGLKGWLRSLVRLPGPLRSGWIRPALATGAFALLAMGALWWKVRDPGGQEARARFTAKGTRFAEAQVLVREQAYPAGSLIAAGPGDTIGVTYRSGDSVHVQVWYREDGGGLRPFSGKDPRGFVLPPATAWTPAPQRILLDGAWRRQEVWIVLSPKTLEPEQVREAIAGRAGKGIEVLPFRMAHGN